MEAERDEVGGNVPWKRLGITEAEYRANLGLTWTGAIVARDEELRGGIGRVLGEPDESGIAWVYWGTGGHGKHESREVVTEMVRLDLNDDFMASYRRHKDNE